LLQNKNWKEELKIFAEDTCKTILKEYEADQAKPLA
jgi:hypothetical protein